MAEAVVIMSIRSAAGCSNLTSDEGYSKKKTAGFLKRSGNTGESRAAECDVHSKSSQPLKEEKYEVPAIQTHDGDPRNIDRNNPFNGEKMFPVTSFGLAAINIPNGTTNYINMTYVSTWV